MQRGARKMFYLARAGRKSAVTRTARRRCAGRGNRTHQGTGAAPESLSKTPRTCARPSRWNATARCAPGASAFADLVGGEQGTAMGKNGVKFWAENVGACPLSISGARMTALQAAARPCVAKTNYRLPAQIPGGSALRTPASSPCSADAGGASRTRWLPSGMARRHWPTSPPSPVRQAARRSALRELPPSLPGPSSCISRAPQRSDGTSR